MKCYHCKVFEKNILLHVLYIDYESADIVYYALNNLLDITFDINILTPLEPMSIAANLSISKFYFFL